ncbi:hypothetical protein FH972_025631 [Carpinus fangiana]|uniref:2-isopropylmalate synthase n=1 Tax=Carpinus fangiana TaxID=176857 RepID=A0A5N6L1Z0_9ROSI|nr:hypothetical protein FH972_025631 [Carpinus fangiana]
MATLIRPPPNDPAVSSMENTLELTRLSDIDPDLFTNTRPLWHPPGARGVYGGAVIAQCLAAAQRTVPKDFAVHSMHCYFVLAGNSEIPIIYHVEHVREGKSFATRTVQARQRGKPIFTVTLSFMREGSAGVKTVEHQTPLPNVPDPASDDQSGFGRTNGPFESQHHESKKGPNGAAHEMQTRMWIRARGQISQQGGHQAHLSALAYMSDSFFIGTVARAHRLWRNFSVIRDAAKGDDRSKDDAERDEEMLRRIKAMNSGQEENEEQRPEVGMMVSLDHTIYFHRPKDFRADEWLFSEMETPWAGDGRGLVVQRIWSRDGKHIATCIQEAQGSFHQVPPLQAARFAKSPVADQVCRQGSKMVVYRSQRWQSEPHRSDASQTDFDFTQKLVQTPGVVPDDVWLQVLSPCRKDFIRRTVDSLQGAKNAILHLYLATSPCFQEIVFNMNNDQTLALAVECTKYARSITKDDPAQAGTLWHYEFSPECFSDSNPEFVIQVCEAVKEAWGPTKEDPLIFNLPATVEMSTPNVYADQIEYFCTHMTEREKFAVSLHPHNDRGCAVAAAELAQMAGADRVEGCLFGNGERTGNVDLVTLALNLYTQGIHPGIDFSDLKSVIDMVEKCCKIPVHERAPYGGALVVCAFSGSHQDAIKKGFQLRKQQGAGPEDLWRLPYLPLDPRDIGRDYEAVIRVNSQSGKGGVAWVIQRTLELDLPRGLQIAFSKIVQKRADAIGRELLPREIQKLFEDAYYINSRAPITLIDYDMTADRSVSPARIPGKTPRNENYKRLFDGIVEIENKEHRIKGTGNGPVSSLSNALQNLNIHIDISDYKEHAIGEGSNVKAVAYVECTSKDATQKVWGIGIDHDVTQASMVAVLAAASAFLNGADTSANPPRGRTNGQAEIIVPNSAILPRINGAPASSQPDAAGHISGAV